MHLQRRRERPRAARPVEPREHPFLLLNILDGAGVVGGGRVRHRFLPKLMGQSTASAPRLPRSPRSRISVAAAINHTGGPRLIPSRELDPARCVCSDLLLNRG
jgi:hypothetical protein